ncbi:MAG: hypothetical protein WCP21_03655 [Armatimonadota bacterium]
MIAWDQWEKIGHTPHTGGELYRFSVPGGWLIIVDSFSNHPGGNDMYPITGLTFYPDPEHQWTP